MKRSIALMMIFLTFLWVVLPPTSVQANWGEAYKKGISSRNGCPGQGPGTAYEDLCVGDLFYLDGTLFRKYDGYRAIADYNQRNRYDYDSALRMSRNLVDRIPEKYIDKSAPPMLTADEIPRDGEGSWRTTAVKVREYDQTDNKDEYRYSDFWLYSEDPYDDRISYWDSSNQRVRYDNPNNNEDITDHQISKYTAITLKPGLVVTEVEDYFGTWIYTLDVNEEPRPQENRGWEIVEIPGQKYFGSSWNVMHLGARLIENTVEFCTCDDWYGWMDERRAGRIMSFTYNFDWDHYDYRLVKLSYDGEQWQSVRNNRPPWEYRWEYIDLEYDMDDTYVDSQKSANFHGTYYYMLRQRKNTAPILTLLENSGSVYRYSGKSKFEIEGYVRDEHGDSVVVTAEVQNTVLETVVKKTILYDTEVDRRFVLSIDALADQLQPGRHTVTITADDRRVNGKTTETFTLNVVEPITDGAVILLNSSVEYVTKYSDPENDPIYSEQFRYEHDPNYYENPMGKIPDTGIWRSPYKTFNKTGHFTIEYRVRDNPKDDNQFDEFRKWSEPSLPINIYVHRKPIADFIAVVERNQTAYDFKLDYINTSYDLDHQSKPDRGIVEERWWWRNNNNYDLEWKRGRPSTVSSRNGVLVRLMVKDREGIWSDPVTKLINPGNNPRPIAGFIVDPDELYKNEITTITSTATHQNPDEPITHQYFIKPEGKPEYAHTTDPDWTVTFPDAGTYTIRQVVQDRRGLAAQHIETVTVSNRLPVVEVTTPGSSSAANPTEYEYGEPVIIHWTYNDPDNDPQTKYQLQIIQHSNNQVLFDSGQVSSSDRKRQAHDLPRGETLKVQVRVYDGYGWSAWSDPKYLYIIDNQPPVPGFTWTPTTIWEGDNVQLRHQVSDPDNDTLQIRYQVTAPNGNVTYYPSSTNWYNVTPANYNSNAFRLNNVLTGTYRVQQIVSDGKAPNQTITKTFNVNALVFEPTLKHIPEWIDYYNENGLSLSKFMAGEPFDVEVLTSPNIRNVTVHFDFPKARVAVPKEFLENPNDDPYPDFSLKTSLEVDDPTNPINWSLTAWKKYWIQIPDGRYNVVVTATYQNGQIRTETFQVTIDGHIWDQKKEGYSNRG